MMKGRKLELSTIPNDVNLFEPLDAVNCRLKHLSIEQSLSSTLFRYLALSNQSKYLETLTLNHTIVNPPNILEDMSCLTSLSLNFINGHMMDFESRKNKPHHVPECMPSNLKIVFTENAFHRNRYRCDELHQYRIILKSETMAFQKSWALSFQIAFPTWCIYHLSVLSRKISTL